ncbi:MAG: tetratricopeptide repeat protein [Gammaproteobacteria bacterium]|nr:MAG: tetratricopeptide repeat protein [Gammaproteobacteria bacterium]
MRAPSLLLLLLALTSCASQKAVNSIDPNTSTEALRAKVVADIALATQNYDVALPKLIEKAQFWHDAEAAQTAVRIAEQRKDWIRSLQAARVWAAIDPENDLAHSVVVLGLARSGQVDALAPALVRLWSAARPKGFQRYIQIVLQLTEQTGNEVMLEALRKIPTSSDAYVASQVAMMEMLRKAGQDDAAVAISKALQQRYPDHPAVILERAYQTQNHLVAGRDLLKAFRKHPEHLVLGIEACRQLLQASPTDVIRACLEQAKPGTRNHIVITKGCLIAADERKQCLDEVMAKAPGNHDLLVMAAGMALDNQNAPQAERYLLQVLAEAPHHQQARWLLAHVYRNSEDRYLKDFAVSLFDSISTPSLVKSARIAAAKMLANDGYYQQAISRLRSLKDADPATQLELARVAAKLLSETPDGRQYKMALDEEWQKQPDDLFLFLLALTLAEHQELTTIWRHYPGLLSPDQAPVRQLVLDILMEKDAHEAVIALTGQVLKHHPDNTLYQYERAIAHFKLGHYTQAEQALRTLLRKSPEDGTYLNALGYILAHANKKLDEAEQLLHKAHSLNPKDGYVLDSLGWLYFRLKQYEKAESYLKKALKQDPNPIVEAHLAAVYWMTDRMDQAKKLFKKAYHAKPNDPVLREIIRDLSPDLFNSLSKK